MSHTPIINQLQQVEFRALARLVGMKDTYEIFFPNMFQTWQTLPGSKKHWFILSYQEWGSFLHIAVKRIPERLKCAQIGICAHRHPCSRSKITLYPLPAFFVLSNRCRLCGERLLWNPSHINYFLFPTCPVTNLGSWWWITLHFKSALNTEFKILFTLLLVNSSLYSPSRILHLALSINWIKTQNICDFRTCWRLLLIQKFWEILYHTLVEGHLSRKKKTTTLNSTIAILFC